MHFEACHPGLPTSVALVLAAAWCQSHHAGLEQASTHFYLRNPGAEVLRAGVSSFVGVSTNTANDDSTAVGSRNSRRADSRSRNSAVDSHSRNKAVDSRSSHGDS